MPCFINYVKRKEGPDHIWRRIDAGRPLTMTRFQQKSKSRKVNRREEDVELVIEYMHN